MYIYDYYIIIYDKLFEYEKKLEKYFLENKIPVNENKIPVNENKIPVNENKIPVNENKIPVNENKIPINENKIPVNENKIPINENKIHNTNDLIKYIDKQCKTKSKTIKESSIWIRKIYIKLIFMYHPDKQINSNDEIFSKIKNDYDKNNYSSLFYYFVKNRDHPYLLRLFNEMIQDKKFIDSLLNLSNYFNFKINIILKDDNFISYLKQNNLFD